MIPEVFVTAWSVDHPLYRPPGFSSAGAEKNLRAKLDDTEFRRDLDPLVTMTGDGYEVDVAADMVIKELFRRGR